MRNVKQMITVHNKTRGKYYENKKNKKSKHIDWLVRLKEEKQLPQVNI